ncbi:MAG: M28 family peptidase [Planctomycetes bacterium]|nr:M28 family peptidase [Planctomycetota bacterium]
MMRPRCVPFVFAATCLCVAMVHAQTAAPAEVITEASVREVVSWLAADERAGRDTGSPELEVAADWLAERFGAAGLKPGAGDSFFHAWSMPGVRLDSTAVSVVLQRKVGETSGTVPLVAGQDVRWWRPSDVLAGTEEACTVALADDPVLQQMLNAKSSRRTILIEVAEHDPYWLRAAGEHGVLGGRREASRPVFLVRKGVLPAPPADGGEVTWSATWSVPEARKADVPLRNVVALLPGASRKDEFVVVSAHYDHIGIGRPVDGDAINNGADDDASGTTAVLLLARAMAQQPPPARSVLFVCFAGEEKGLRGSAAFCERPPVPLERIVANLNIEMIGRPEPGNEGKAWITGNDLSDFARIVEAPLQRAGVLLVDFRMASQLFAQSDNWSFVRHGIVAHSLSAGSLHADYHRPSDEVDRLDLPHMTRIVGALLPAVRELADRDAAPAWNEKGRKLLERARR